MRYFFVDYFVMLGLVFNIVLFVDNFIENVEIFLGVDCDVVNFIEIK